MIMGWLFIASAAFLGVFFGMLAYATWRGNQHSARNEQSRARNDAVTTETVQCPCCGTTNERGYRYCRECLDDLPTGVSYVPDSVGSDNRQIP